MIESLKCQGTDLLQEGFEKLIYPDKIPVCYTKISFTMAKSITCGLHSLPCRVANCVRYVLVHLMNEESSFSGQGWRDNMYEIMVADAFCKDTVDNLFQKIRDILVDHSSTISVEAPLYAVDVRRIKENLTNFKDFLTDTKVLKDLRKFLEFAHSALKEPY